MNAKRVLIACDTPRTILEFRGKLIEAMSLNNKVYVFTPVIAQEFIRKKLESFGVTIIETSLNGSNVSVFSDLKYILKLFKVIHSLKPDVFFPYTLKPVIYGSLVANFCRVKLVAPMLSGLGYNFADSQSKNTIVKKITRALLRKSLDKRNKIHLILQNKDDYKTLLNQRIIDENSKAFVVNGSGVDLSHYDYSVPDSHNISFVMIARLINAKGINEYYKAAKAIRSQFPQIRFKLVGSYDNNIDSIDKSLFEEIKTSGVLDYIGQVNDIRPHIKRTSVVVLPSYYGEGVPRCILEALAMGRAVITSDSVGCRETVNIKAGATNGFLVPVKDIPSLVAKMEYFILNPNDIVKFGINGRKYAEEKFDVQLVNKQMLKIMELI
ncbi:glycosyltransferase family 4 protein [Desertivirga arenae]|uniref:glycosyltransferase family 4 protein n=1 Tax=Desertivirga arenae TaxID=2810309 RepID=UPI001A969DF0|nr:glycosyltransferase family 4 protein [Pedobacter sp. SYSU D00823]